MLYLLISTAIAATEHGAKVIPIAEVNGVQYVLAWLTQNEERTYVLAMFLMFVGRELYGLVKIKFGRVGNELEALKNVPHKLNEMELAHRSQGEDIKELVRAFNKFEREVHKQIKEEVRYSLDVIERRRSS